MYSLLLDYTYNYDYNSGEVIRMKYDFGLRLRAYREVTGLDYAQLSQALRERGYVITPRRIKGIEEGNSQPNTKDLLAFARFFHIRIADLLGV